MNAANDNPLIFDKDDETLVISGETSMDNQ